MLEHEFKLVESQSEEEAIDRKHAIEIKLNMLVVLVQTGQLTMEMYLENVAKSIKRTKQLALLLSKLGRNDLAKKALKRIKIMQAEVDEVANSQMA